MDVQHFDVEHFTDRTHCIGSMDSTKGLQKCCNFDVKKTPSIVIRYSVLCKRNVPCM